MILSFGLGRGFSPSADAPTIPDAGTLAVVDQQDGTGATATIGGTAGGSDNDILVYRVPGELELVDSFTRSGNGAVDLVLDVGTYLAVLASEGFYAATPVLFSVTDSSAGLTSALGPITLAEHHAMLTLANCTAFQSWAGVLTEAAAKARIYFDWPPPPASDAYTAAELATLRPYAVVQTPERGRGFGSRRAATGTYTPSGVILIDLVQNVPTQLAGDPAEAFRQFKNALGRIIDYPSPSAGLVQLAYEAPDDDHLYLAINGVDCYGPRRADEEEAVQLGDFLHAQLVLHWGP